jgi:DtxR family Mn-dependent transcriptional regulator
MLSVTEENYLKAIYQISHQDDSVNTVGTNELAARLSLKPATVNDMLKKLKEKKLVVYEKYGKIELTHTGSKIAVYLVRKHRLWETFLVSKLRFNWHEVHDVAEQLEHVNSVKLIERLDEFLHYPEFDPHGDPIPDSKGKIRKSSFIKLSHAKIKIRYKVMGVRDYSILFLKYLEKNNFIIGTSFQVISIEDFDGSFLIKTVNGQFTVSNKAADFIIIEEV